MAGFPQSTRLGAQENLRWGLRLGLIMATCFSVAVVIARVVIGPGALQRFGISWAAIIAVYYVALSLGGLAFGALLPLKRHPLGAMVLGFLLVLPMYAALSVLMGLGLKEIPSVRVGLIIGAILAAVVGGAVGISIWSDEQKEQRDVQTRDPS